jgi:FRG domain
MSWAKTDLKSVNDVLDELTNLRGRRWLCRGQSSTEFGGLTPTIDRKDRIPQNLTRPQKLALERRSIDIFRSTVRFFADEGEKVSLRNDVIALAVLRHYGVPTRLLDWSLSPFVAAYFAVAGDTRDDEYDDKDGEIWAFDYDLYEQNGKEQWKKWPETTRNRDGVSFDAGLTAFLVDEPPDWFICAFYDEGFPRQNAQQGFYSMTARFGRDHSEAIAQLLERDARYHRYVIDKSIDKNIKSELRRYLREQHGIWRGSLYPDSAGAAATACRVFK